MVRTYQRKYTNTRNGKSHTPYVTYSEENLRKAVEAVQNRLLTLKEAAETYKIPKSTLSRKYRNINCTQEKAGHPTLFTKEEEKSFIDNIKLLSSWGFPLDSTDLRVYAQKYLNKIGKTIYSLQDNMPGVDWARNFLNRYKSEISNRTASNISISRAKTTPKVIDDFFDNYGKSVEGVSPDCIINYDETNVTDDPGSKKHIFKRGCKYPERIMNSSKSSISLMFAGTADGQTLPIYVVYKADHLWDQWLVGGPEGTRYNRSKSGWFDSVCFEDWFNTVIVPYAKTKSGQKVVMVGDNLSSHFSQSVLKTCQEMNITFTCLPPMTTHLLQPLDVAFYAPLKKYWRDILTKWKKTEGLKHKTLVKSSFPKLLRRLKNKLVENGTESNNLIAGFNKCGLYPINPERPKTRLPQRDTISEELIQNSTSLAVLEMLQEMRTPVSSTEKTKRKRKCNVPPGKSITAEDLEQIETEKAEKQPKRKNTKKKKKENGNSLDKDSNTDSKTAKGNTKDELNLVDTQPTAGPSGLCNAHSFDSDSTYCSLDDEIPKHEIIKGTNMTPKIEECVSIKGKGKGKKSKSKTETNPIKISNLENKSIPEENIAIKDKIKKRKPTTKKRQMKISDLKNLDLDPESIERLIASVKAEKSKKKKTKKNSDSDTSVSDIMSIHSDSDIIDVGLDESSSDERSKNEGYECNKDIPNNYQKEQMQQDESKVHKYCIDNKELTDAKDQQNCNVTSVKFFNDNNIDNLKTDLEYGIYKTDEIVSSSAILYDKVSPAPEIPRVQEFNDIQKVFEPMLDLCQNENDQNYNNTSQEQDKSTREPDEHPLYAVNDHVLVRYCDNKKWKYYVGFIENIKSNGHKYQYTVNFLKTIKKPQLAFRIVKKIDRDEVDDIWIVKKVGLNKNPMNAKEYLFAEKTDEIYFFN